jgi:hypothetical protein
MPFNNADKDCLLYNLRVLTSMSTLNICLMLYDVIASLSTRHVIILVV